MNAVPEVVSSVMDGLKGQPLAVALVVINAAFLLMLYLLFDSVSARNAATFERNDKLVAQLIAQCEGTK